MRLIDADALIEKLKSSLVTPNYHPDLGDAFQCTEAEEHNEEIVCMMETVNQQPTAYDVDKIVEQISRIKENVAKNIRLCSQEDDIEREVKYSAYPYDKCIEIVKGAVEDE